MNNLVEKALCIAIIAHRDQKRKNDGSPYAMHPLMVALKLARHEFSDTVIAAALVHDVLEDTNFSKDEMQRQLGDEVLVIVTALSENKSLSWKERKECL